MFNLGIGLLAAGGPRRGPKISLGQGFAEASQYANTMQSQYNELQAQRQQINQQQVFKQIGGLLSPQMSPGPVVGPIGPAPASTPQGRQQLIGLLGQVAPNAVASSILSKVLAEPQQPTLSRNVNDFLFFQNHPELKEAFQHFSENNRDPEAILRQQELQLRVENQLQEMSERNETRAQTTAQTQISALKDLEDLKKAGEANLNLIGTFLELGVPARGLARTVLGTVKAAQDALGLDSANAGRVITEFDNFQKLSSNITLNSLPRFTALGAINSSELEQVVQANAQIGASPETNALIIADAIRTIVRSANASSIDISDSDDWLEYADSLVEMTKQKVGSSLPVTQPSTPANVIRFSELPD
jgi:hypothetical protein